VSFPFMLQQGGVTYTLFAVLSHVGARGQSCTRDTRALVFVYLQKCHPRPSGTHTSHLRAACH
jgi:hypothetical protein